MSALQAVFVDTGAWVVVRELRRHEELGLQRFFGFHGDFARAAFTAFL
jgi:hypothetical protein